MTPSLKRIAGLAACALLLATAAPASAHITFDQPFAQPGDYYVGFFRISHGCEGSPTVSVRIVLPADIVSARPQAKAGWTVAIETEALPAPVTLEGKSVARRVSAVTWTGRLEADQFDQFGLMLRTPRREGLMYFPVVQTCVTGETRWTDIPAEGQAWHDVPHPAPVVELIDQTGALGATTAAAHDHH